MDLDGTVYRGDRAIDGVVEAICFLKAHNKEVFFVTNSNVSTPTKVCAKLKKLGIKNVVEDDIFMTSTWVPRYIQKTHPQAKKVYIVGSSSLKQAFRDANFLVNETSPENFMKEEEEYVKLSKELVDEDYDGVVVGMDYHFNYNKVFEATSVLNQGGLYEDGKRKKTFFYACNDDMFDNVGGAVLPDTGVVLHQLQLLTQLTRMGNDPPYGPRAVVLGKPNPAYILDICDRKSLDANNRCLFVGDRLDTDILGGARAGMDTLLVLSGVHDSDAAEDLNAFVEPTYICKSFAEADRKSVV